MPIKPFSESFIGEGNAPFAEVKNIKPLVYTKINIAELPNHLDIKFCDAHDSWLQIGEALFNADFDKIVFDVFSERSYNYSDIAVNDHWASLERKPLECTHSAAARTY
jgi:hypothetical protein